MKIITTTEDDFFKSEVEEWGFDYVDAKFTSGYEPGLVNGIWCWVPQIRFNTSVLSSSSYPLKGSNSLRPLSRV